MWSPADGDNCTAEFQTPDELRQSDPEFEAHSRYFDHSYGAIFKSAELGDYELAQPLPEIEDSLPARVQQLLGWSESAGAHSRRVPV